MISLALAEIWPEEEATCTDASWMLSTTLRRFATIAFRLRPSVPTSSSPCASMFTTRSPLATCSEASAIACSGRSQRPASAQPTADPSPTRTTPSKSASIRRRRCTARSARWLIATSTPPFTASAAPAAAAAAVSSPSPPPLDVVTGARNSSTGSPSVVDPSRSSSLAAGSRGSSRIALPVCASGSPLASRIMAPTTSEASPVPPALTAPSRNCVSSGLSSVSTPYFALKARLLAT